MEFGTALPMGIMFSPMSLYSCFDILFKEVRSGGRGNDALAEQSSVGLWNVGTKITE